MNIFLLLAGLAALPPASGSSFVIEHATIEIGDGSSLEDASVVVDKSIIKAVGARVEAPGVRTIDGRGKVVSPGLVESASSLGLVEVSAVESSNDRRLHGANAAPAFRATDGFNPLSIHIPVARKQGITTAVCAPGGTLLYGVAGLFDLTGDAGVVPRPAAMFGGVGAGAAAALGKSRGGVWLRMREIVSDTIFYRSHRKAFEQGRSRPLSLAPMHHEALYPVLDGTMPLVLEANRESDIRTALGFARAHGIRLVISGGAEAWLVADELAAASVPVILAPSYQGPFGFDSLHARDDLASILDARGVKVIITSGSWVGRLRQEAGIAVAYGLDRSEAIRAITLAPAEVFGRADRIGSIAPGKRANLVLWSGDPLETTTIAERVWIDGVAQSLVTRQDQLARRYLDAHPAP